MSERKNYNITCPSCQLQQDVELCIAIHAETDTTEVLGLMQNQLNRVSCTGCENSFRVDMPVLYSDRERGLLVHWIPAPDGPVQTQVVEDFEESMSELRGSFPAGTTPPRIRLVFSRVELVELIFMSKEKMDERVVEYVKYNIYTRNQKKVPYEQFRLLLNIQDSTDDELCFVMQDIKTNELGKVLRYGRAAYQSLCDLYKESPHEFDSMFPGPYINARFMLLEDGFDDEELAQSDDLAQTEG